MDAVDQRKKQREAKLFMKQTRANVIQEREKQKKNDLDEIKRWKQDRKNGGGDDDDEDALPPTLGKRKAPEVHHASLRLC
jgi:hypothetical protein